ncbi:unnamed protein product, partial [Tilletia controversa]
LQSTASPSTSQGPFSSTIRLVPRYLPRRPLMEPMPKMEAGGVPAVQMSVTIYPFLSLSSPNDVVADHDLALLSFPLHSHSHLSTCSKRTPFLVFANGNGSAASPTSTPQPLHQPDSPSDDSRAPFLGDSASGSNGAAGVLRVDPRLGRDPLELQLGSSSGGGGGCGNSSGGMDLRSLPPILSYCAASIAMTVIPAHTISKNLMIILIAYGGVNCGSAAASPP